MSNNGLLAWFRGLQVHLPRNRRQFRIIQRLNEQRGNAVERELTRLLSEHGTPTSLRSENATDEIRGATFNAAHNAKPRAIGTGVWCVWIDLVEGAPVYLAGAMASFVVAIALIVYGVWFYRKMKRLRIIA